MNYEEEDEKRTEKLHQITGEEKIPFDVLMKELPVETLGREKKAILNEFFHKNGELQDFEHGIKELIETIEIYATYITKIYDLHLLIEVLGDTESCEDCIGYLLHEIIPYERGAISAAEKWWIQEMARSGDFFNHSLISRITSRDRGAVRRICQE